jgi:D-beta-D-heptose 7-phosphate kinase / D-beta-D-heptose 1-phosphate adenosyltransferase
MFNFEDAFKLIPQQTIVCVGDLMLDDFVYGEVSRISPEAPAPILAVKRNELTVGGAGNVARNIAALGARCIFLGVVGEDEASRTLMRALSAEPLIEPHLVVDAERPTTRKVRFVSEHHSTHLLRADWELAKAINANTEKVLIDRTLAALPRAASVVLSDYAKGTLTPRVIREVIDAARKAGIPVIIDPKAADYSVYRGATVIKPNRKELSEATHRRADSDADVIAAALELNRSLGTDAVVVSLSDAGLILVPANGETIHLPAYPVKLRDTSGAGDTVVAALAVLLATKLGYEPAVRAANAAAAVVVGKRGTSTVSAAELRSRILPAASLAREEKARRVEGSARRLHQWLLRSAAPRPYQAPVRGARRLRSAHCRAKRRRVCDALEGRRSATAGGTRARGGAGCARSGRPRRRVRSGHAAGTDPARAS